MHEHMVLILAEAGVDRLAGKRVRQERLPRLRPIERLLQTPTCLGILETLRLAVEYHLLNEAGDSLEVLHGLQADRLPSPLGVADRPTTLFGGQACAPAMQSG